MTVLLAFKLTLDIDEKVAASFAITDAWQVGFVTARIFLFLRGIAMARFEPDKRLAQRECITVSTRNQLPTRRNHKFNNGQFG
jgi:hypothetical protein